MNAPARRSLRFQMIAVLILGLLISHIVGFVLYSTDRRTAMSTSEAFDIAERASGVVVLLRNLPEAWRADVLAASDRRAFRVWRREEPIVPVQPPTAEEEKVLDYLRSLLPRLAERDMRVSITPAYPPGVPDRRNDAPGAAPGPEVDIETEIVSIAIDHPDGFWLNFAGVAPKPPSLIGSIFGGYLVSIIFGVTIVAFWLVGRVTRPLERFARAAERLGKDIQAAPLDETGPVEVARASHAFNLMQERLARLVRERTELLAAISHDLRTPITQLKLRAELIEDEAEREKFFAALEEMELIIATFLDYARSAFGAEERSRIDLTSLIESIGGDMTDAGANIDVIEGERLHFACKRLALKRGVANLADNAVKYAGGGRIAALKRGSDIVIRVEDDGPGIAEDRLDEMLMPFRRGEPSRNRRTGGLGLGLSIAQAVAHDHGGTLVLANRPEGGLRAEMILPA